MGESVAGPGTVAFDADGQRTKTYGLLFVLVDDRTRAPIPRRRYRLESHGDDADGRTDAGGRTRPMVAPSAEQVRLFADPQEAIVIE